jgi:predicted TIM-barrel enzyme
VTAVAEIAAAAKKVRSDVIVLCHGGPIAEPADAKYVLERCEIEGFYGASSMERLPTEIAITGQVKKFVNLEVTRRKGT